MAGFGYSGGDQGFEGQPADREMSGSLLGRKAHGIEDLSALLGSKGDLLTASWPARWSYPGRTPRKGLLLLSSLGIHFAEEIAPLLRSGRTDYRLRPEAEVSFTADYYFGQTVLDLSRPPSGTPLIHVGLSMYEVDEPGDVFDAIYRAKEAVMVRDATLFPRAAHTRPAPPGQTTVVRTVVHEVVKVPCRYCGSLVDLTATTCSSCGAPLR
jgi:hypothetical protein